MKGIAKRVIELCDPQHPDFERVYVVLRSDAPGVRISTARAEAEKYVAGLVCWRKKLWPSAAGVIALCILCMAAGGAAVFFLV